MVTKKVNQKEVAKSFIYSFIAVYFLYYSGSIAIGIFNYLGGKSMDVTPAASSAQNMSMAISSATGGFADWVTIVIVVGVCAMILCLIFMAFARDSMGAAY